MNRNFFEKQMLVDGFNKDSLNKLLDSKVLIIGCGGVGHPAIIYLLSSGIGNLYIVDDDLVDFNNLHRQFIFDQNDIGKSKVEIIKSKLAEKYPHSNIISINKRIDEKYLFEIIDDIDVVIDASDNFETRYLVNDICVEKQVPLVSGSCINQEGQIISFKNNDSGPCYECLFPRKKNLLDQNCESEGVIPTVAGSIGAFSSMQAISIILGDEECFNKLILINMKAGKIAQSFLSENPGCIICS